MILKFIKNNEVVFNRDVAKDLTKEDELELRKFNEEEITCYSIEFVVGTKVKDIKSIDDLTEENTKHIAITIS